VRDEDSSERLAIQYPVLLLHRREHFGEKSQGDHGRSHYHLVIRPLVFVQNVVLPEELTQFVAKVLQRFVSFFALSVCGQFGFVSYLEPQTSSKMPSPVSSDRSDSEQRLEAIPIFAQTGRNRCKGLEALD
jgi:hypothetical protein